MKAWVHLIDGTPDRVFLGNPNTRNYRTCRDGYKAMYGKRSRIVECKVTYSVPDRRKRANGKIKKDI